MKLLPEISSLTLNDCLASRGWKTIKFTLTKKFSWNKKQKERELVNILIAHFYFRTQYTLNALLSGELGTYENIRYANTRISFYKYVSMNVMNEMN